MADFQFAKWQMSAILNFQKLEITPGPVRGAHCASYAKFREDTLNRSGDMADFRFFKMAATTILDFGNFNF